MAALYQAPRWLRGGHLQTLYAALLMPVPPLVYRREIWPTPDQDIIAVDRIDGPAAAPLVVLYHGLEGSARSFYARHLLLQVAHRGWRGAVVHFRGCGGLINQRPRAYHAGDSAEIDWTLQRFAAEGGPVLAVGVSLGGNALLKWAGEAGNSAGQRVAALVAVSVPVDLRASGDTLDRGFKRLVYTRHFLATMVAKAHGFAERHPGSIPLAEIRHSRTLRRFDDLFTAPLHGYRDVDDYWLRASSGPRLRQIQVPTLFLHARNDPFLPAAALPTAAAVSSSVELAISDSGGHVGFVSGAYPGNMDWLCRRILDFGGFISPPR